MSGKITVNLSGTFSEKQRPNNGLEEVAAYLNTHRLTRVPIVGYVEWHTHGESRTGEKMAVVLPAVEPGIAGDGSVIAGLPVPDGFPVDAGGQIMWLLDTLRRRGGKGAVADTLFSVPASEIHRDEDDEEPEPRFEGEEPIPGADPVVRVGPDGPRVVPPPSGEEIMAERAEAAVSAAVTEVTKDKMADLRRRVTGSAEVPAATFAAPAGDPA